MNKDIKVLIEVLGAAKREGLAPWLAAENRLCDNRASMRRHRAMQSRKRFDRSATGPLWIAQAERAIKRLKTDNRRVRRLVRAYASWQRPANLHGIYPACEWAS